MFNLISKKRIEKEIQRVFAENSTSRAHSENDLYYRMGNANALNALIARLKLPCKESGEKMEES